MMHTKMGQNYITKPVVIIICLSDQPKLSCVGNIYSPWKTTLWAIVSFYWCDVKKSAGIWQVLIWQTIHILFYRDSTWSLILYSLIIQSNLSYILQYIYLSFCQLVLTRMKNSWGWYGQSSAQARNKLKLKVIFSVIDG